MQGMSYSFPVIKSLELTHREAMEWLFLRLSKVIIVPLYEVHHIVLTPGGKVKEGHVEG